MVYLAKTTAKGHDYYKIMESYRENGKVKHRVVKNIGTLSKLFELLPQGFKRGSAPTSAASVGIELDEIEFRVHGAPFLLWKVAEWIGVAGMMSSAFPPTTANSVGRATSLLLATVHRACEPGSKAEFPKWFAGTSLPERLGIAPAPMDSKHFWSQMNNISKEQIKEFEDAFFRRVMELFPEEASSVSTLSADFTNYYTYIKNGNFRCTVAQLGHSKEGRSDLRIVNAAVVISPLLGIPLATMTYEGNDNDKTALKSFLGEISERLGKTMDLTSMTYIFDGGGASEEAIGMIPGKFITRGSLRSSPELYEFPLSAYGDVVLGNGKTVKVLRSVAEQFGKGVTAIVTLSDELREGQERELDKQVSNFLDNAGKLNDRIQNERSTTDKRREAIESRVKGMMHSAFRMDEFIELRLETEEIPDPKAAKAFAEEKRHARKEKREPRLEWNGMVLESEADIPAVESVKSFSCIVDAEKKKAMCDKYYGKHLLVTDQTDWSTQKILDVYREQECIERYFRDSKDTEHFSVRPSYHWTDQKLRVHVMLCYLGLSLCRIAQHILKKELGYSATCPALMERLSRVREGIVLMTFDGCKLEPEKRVSKLDAEDGLAWAKVTELLSLLEKWPYGRDSKRKENTNCK